MSAPVVRFDESAETLLVWCTACTLRELFPAAQRADAQTLKQEHAKLEETWRSNKPAASRADPLSDALSDVLGLADAPLIWAQLVAALDARRVPWSRGSIQARLRSMIASGQVVTEGNSRARTYAAATLARRPSIPEAIARVLSSSSVPLSRAEIGPRLDGLGAVWTTDALRRRLRVLVREGSVVAEGYGRWTVYRLSGRTKNARRTK